MNARQNRYPSVADRIKANVRHTQPPTWAEVSGPCWEWTGSLNARGYGHMTQRVRGIKHRCSNKRCCNPSHIDPGDRFQNAQYYQQVERVAGGVCVNRGTTTHE